MFFLLYDWQKKFIGIAAGSGISVHANYNLQALEHHM
jgi:hypothetical protein